MNTEQPIEVTPAKNKLLSEGNLYVAGFILAAGLLVFMEWWNWFGSDPRLPVKPAVAAQAEHPAHQEHNHHDEASSEPPVQLEQLATSDEWVPAADLAKLAGDWGDPDGKPVPKVKVAVQREGSKTPYNVGWFISESASGGCGFYDTGTAFCQVFEGKDHKVPKAVKTTVALHTKGDLLRVTVAEVTQLIVRRN